MDGVAGAEADLTALLADRRHRDAVGGDPFELLEDDVLALAVELQRHVAALSAALVLGPRGDPLRGAEEVRLPGGHPAAGIEPIDDDRLSG